MMQAVSDRRSLAPVDCCGRCRFFEGEDGRGSGRCHKITTEFLDEVFPSAMGFRNPPCGLYAVRFDYVPF